MGTRRNGTTLATQEFGALERDPQREAYIGTLEWCGTQVQLALACADNVDPQHALSIAVGLSQKQPDWDSRIREFAADELLILKNQNWLEDDEPELSREEFVSRMFLIDIVIDGDGTFAFSFGDDDMFWGHNIVIVGNLAGLRQADLTG